MRFLLTLLSCTVVAWATAAAAPQLPQREAPLEYVRFSDIKISFSYKAPKDQDKPTEVHLHVSKDRGVTWETAQKTRPETKHFVFRAPKDGEYWLMSRTKYESGKYLPSGPAKAEIKVVVDTTQPELALEAVRGEGGEVHVRWKLHDVNLAPETFKIEYKVAGANQSWQRVAVDPPAAEKSGEPHEGEIAFVPQGRPDFGTITVRAEAADRAENRTIAERAVAPADSQGPSVGVAAAGAVGNADASSEGEEDSLPGPGLGPAAGRLPPPAMSDRFPDDVTARRTPFPATEAETPYPRTETPGWPPRTPNPAADRPPAASDPRQSGQAPSPRAPASPVSEPVRPAVAARYESESVATAGEIAAASSASASLPPGVQPHMVNKPRFELLYDVESVGSAGISRIELWGTRDGGQTWSSFGVDEDGRSPMLVNVDGEGVYGFRVVVTTGAGVEGAVPSSGELPDVWVGVDLTKPQGNLVSAVQGSGDEAGEMVISWEAGDERLAARPVSLRMSESPDGPWHTIASGLENTGRYAWTGHTGDALFVNSFLLPELAARLAKRFPEHLRILFGPTGVLGEIRGKRYARFPHESAFDIEDQCLQALGTVVNGQQEVFSAHQAPFPDSGILRRFPSSFCRQNFGIDGAENSSRGLEREYFSPDRNLDASNRQSV